MNKTLLQNIKALVFDVDGVFTDGGVQVQSDGDLLRTYNSKDGYAIRYAVEQGMIIGIITGGASESIRHRFAQLGVTDVYLKSRNKIADFQIFCQKHNLKREEILYMGDDIPDIPVMKVVGVSAVPCDAVYEVLEVAQYVSPRKGGDGCVREIIEQVLKIHNKWHIPQEGISE